ncbi:MAG: hypothetical protein K2Q10_02790 [Rhodospirillales bacterium]|nr:hypothetical protein [Rhodospirillales bacterium]
MMNYNGGLERAGSREELMRQVFRLEVEFDYRLRREKAGYPPVSAEVMEAELQRHRDEMEGLFPEFSAARSEATDHDLMCEGYKTDDLIFGMLTEDPSVEWREWEATGDYATQPTELPLAQAREALAEKLAAFCLPRDLSEMEKQAKARAAKATDKEIER